MKKNMLILFFFLTIGTAIGQTNISSTITGLVYNDLYGTYYESGNTSIGSYLNYHYYALCVFDLNQLNGTVTGVSSGVIVLSLDQNRGYNGAGWDAGFIHSDITGSSNQSKVNAIRNMSGVHKHETEDIQLSISMSSIVNNKIIVGVRRNGGQKFVSECSGSISATVVQKVTLTISYNQGGGNIVAYTGSAYFTPAAPATIQANENTQITIAPLSPTIANYSLAYNENQGIYNKSFWQKYNSNGIAVAGDIGKLDPAQNSFPMIKSEDYYKYEAQMRKLCVVTFNSNAGISAIVGPSNTSQTLPYIETVIEQNSTNLVTVPNIFNGPSVIGYFVKWSNNSTELSQSTFASEHLGLTAYYKFKPTNDSRNLVLSGAVGGNVTLNWNLHPSSYVTGYKIFRKLYGQNEEYLTTVGNTTSQFVDFDYKVSENLGPNSRVGYDVRAVCVTQIPGDPNYTMDADPDFVNQFAIPNIDPSNHANSDFSGFELEKSQAKQKLGAYPNPFNPTTRIKYLVTETAYVSLKIYNLLSQEVANLVDETKSTGVYTVNFNARNLPTGTYIARLQVGSKHTSMKLQLIK